MAMRVAVHSWAAVQAANARGQCWLALDGMVMDVTTWLPQHPGGSSIIPAQALNLDCSRFFEVWSGRATKAERATSQALQSRRCRIPVA